MRILVGFATTEGHTRTLARFIADRLIKGGHHVTLADLGQPGAPDLAAFERAFLAASLHMSRYQRPFVDFARRHHATLNAMPAAFVSVSLSAAGNAPNDRAGLAACVARLTADTGWTPTAIHYAAGAMPFRAYGWLTKLAIWLIVRRHGLKVRISEDYDLTDYAAVGRFAEEFAGG